MSSSVTNLIGKRVALDEYECMGALGSPLPLTGRIEQQIAAENGVKDWFLVRLDTPLMALQVSPPFSIEKMKKDELLIRSRWSGCPIGSEPSVSVFVLLVHENALDHEPINPKDFYFPAWAGCRFIEG